MLICVLRPRAKNRLNETLPATRLRQMWKKLRSGRGKNCPAILGYTLCERLSHHGMDLRIRSNGHVSACDFYVLGTRRFNLNALPPIDDAVIFRVDCCHGYRKRAANLFAAIEPCRFVKWRKCRREWL
jgi:hypothetical protein